MKAFKESIDGVEMLTDQRLEKATVAMEELIKACKRHDVSLPDLSSHELFKNRQSLMTQVVAAFSGVPIERDEAQGAVASGVRLEAALNIVSELIRAGAPVNQASTERWVPLHYAANAGIPELLELLVDAGADVNAIDEDNSSVLFFAINPSRHEEMTLPMVNYLVSKGADVHHKAYYLSENQSVSLMQAAIIKSKAPVIHRLMELGVSLDGIRLQHEPSSALHLAVAYDNLEALKTLLPYLDVNQLDAQLNTPLHMAIKRNRGLMIEPLVEAGADIHLKNKVGESPLDLVDQADFIAYRSYLKAINLVQQEKKLLGSMLNNKEETLTSNPSSGARSVRI